jgi:hypothetical protein
MRGTESAEELELAERQIKIGFDILKRQKELVVELTRRGFDTKKDRRLLAQLEDLQTQKCRDRDLLLARLNDQTR